MGPAPRVPSFLAQRLGCSLQTRCPLSGRASAGWRAAYVLSFEQGPSTFPGDTERALGEGGDLPLGHRYGADAQQKWLWPSVTALSTPP